MFFTPLLLITQITCLSGYRLQKDMMMLSYTSHKLFVDIELYSSSA